MLFRLNRFIPTAWIVVGMILFSPLSSGYAWPSIHQNGNPSFESLDAFFAAYLIEQGHWEDFFFQAERSIQEKEAGKALVRISTRLYREGNENLLSELIGERIHLASIEQAHSKEMGNLLRERLESWLQDHPPKELSETIFQDLEHKRDFQSEARHAPFVKGLLKGEKYRSIRHANHRAFLPTAVEMIISDAFLVVRASIEGGNGFSYIPPKSAENNPAFSIPKMGSKSTLRDITGESTEDGPGKNGMEGHLFAKPGGDKLEPWKDLLIYHEDEHLERTQLAQMFKKQFVKRTVGSLPENEHSIQLAQVVLETFSSHVPRELIQAVAERLVHQHRFQSHADPVRQYVQHVWARLNLPEETPQPSEKRQSILQCTHKIVDQIAHSLENALDPEGKHTFPKRDVRVSLEGLTGEFSAYSPAVPVNLKRPERRVNPGRIIKNLEREIPKALLESKSWGDIATSYDQYAESLSFEIRRIVGYAMFFRLIQHGWLRLPVSEKGTFEMGMVQSGPALLSRAMSRLVPLLNASGVDVPPIQLWEFERNNHMQKLGKAAREQLEIPFDTTTRTLDLASQKIPKHNAPELAFLDLSFLPYLPSKGAKGINGRLLALYQASEVIQPEGFLFLSVDRGSIDEGYFEAFEKLGFALEARRPSMNPIDDVIIQLAPDPSLASHIKDKLESSEWILLRRTEQPALSLAEVKRLQMGDLRPANHDVREDRVLNSVQLTKRVDFGRVALSNYGAAESESGLVNLFALANAQITEGPEKSLRKTIANEMVHRWRSILSGNENVARLHETLVSKFASHALPPKASLEHMVADQMEKTLTLILQALDQQEGLVRNGNLEAETLNERKSSILEEVSSLRHVDIAQTQRRRSELDELNASLKETLSEYVKAGKWTQMMTSTNKALAKVEKESWIMGLAEPIFRPHAKALAEFGIYHARERDFGRGLNTALLRELEDLSTDAFFRHLSEFGVDVIQIFNTASRGRIKRKMITPGMRTQMKKDILNQIRKSFRDDIYPIEQSETWIPSERADPQYLAEHEGSEFAKPRSQEEVQEELLQLKASEHPEERARIEKLESLNRDMSQWIQEFAQEGRWAQMVTPQKNPSKELKDARRLEVMAKPVFEAFAPRLAEFGITEPTDAEFTRGLNSAIEAELTRLDGRTFYTHMQAAGIQVLKPLEQKTIDQVPDIILEDMKSRLLLNHRIFLQDMIRPEGDHTPWIPLERAKIQTSHKGSGSPGNPGPTIERHRHQLPRLGESLMAGNASHPYARSKNHRLRPSLPLSPSENPTIRAPRAKAPVLPELPPNSEFPNTKPNPKREYAKSYSGYLAGRIGSELFWSYVDHDFSDMEHVLRESLSPMDFLSYNIFAGVQTGFSMGVQMHVPEKYMLGRYFLQHGAGMAAAMWVSGLATQILKTGNIKGSLAQYLSEEALRNTGITAGSFMVARLPLSGAKAWWQLRQANRGKQVLRGLNQVNYIRRGLGLTGGVVGFLAGEVLVFTLAKGLERVIIPAVDARLAKNQLTVALNRLNSELSSQHYESHMSEVLHAFFHALETYEQRVILRSFVQEHAEYMDQHMHLSEHSILALEMAKDPLLFEAVQSAFQNLGTIAEMGKESYDRMGGALELFRKAQWDWQEHIQQGSLPSYLQQCRIDGLSSPGSKETFSQTPRPIDTQNPSEPLFQDFISCYTQRSLEAFDLHQRNRWKEKFTENMGYEEASFWRSNYKYEAAMENQKIPFPKTAYEVRLFKKLILENALKVIQTRQNNNQGTLFDAQTEETLKQAIELSVFEKQQQERFLETYLGSEGPIRF